MKRSMKRLTAPRSWPVPRKTSVWVKKPSPGPHPTERCMPLVGVARDMLKICDSANEARRIIGNREVLVDGRVVKNHKMPVGLMDVISLPKLDQHYRLLLNRRGKFILVALEEGAENWKLCRIENKTTVKGGKIQLNLHDGRNLLIEGNRYRTGDVLRIEVPSQEILDVFEMSSGNLALVISGAHIGEVMTIESLKVERKSAPNVVEFTDGSSTVKPNVFVIGSKESAIKLPGASII